MVEAIKRIFSSQRILGIYIFVSMYACAAQETDGALKAQREYTQGNWKQASALYEAIEPKNSAVWYNLGNSYYQQQRCADALACWKHAQRGASYSQLADIEKNIACLSKQTGACCNQNTWYARMRSVIPSPWIIQLLFLFFWYLLCALILVRRRIVVRYFSVVCGATALISGLLGILLLIQYRDCHMNSGIIVDTMVPVCAGPHTQYHVLATLNEMDEVIIHAQRPGWYKIGTQNVQGWIPARTVRII